MAPPPQTARLPAMRLHQVTSRLFTGPRMGPDQLLWANEIGITHWINVAREISRSDLGQQLIPTTTAIPVYDREKDITDEWLSTIIHTGLPILSVPDTKLLITCNAGLNRAPTAAYALLRAFGLPQIHAKNLSKDHIAPKYAHIVDRFVDRTLNLG